jgi:hypothetical protein
MHISNAADFEWAVNVPHRPGEARSKKLIDKSGYLKALKVGVSRVLGEKTTPRHHHDFDQFRIGLEGVLDFGLNQKLTPRVIMYVPAGTWYGPESWHGENHPDATKIALFQFDGECQAGMLSGPEIDVAMEELKKTGEFRNGFYYANEPGERKAVDAYEACWEKGTGKKVSYPAAFVDHPIYMHVDAVAWAPSHEAGVQTKLIGAWGNHGLRLTMSRVSRGADHVIFNTRQRMVAFALSGDSFVNGKPFAEHSAVLCEPGETAIVKGVAEATELIELALPKFEQSTV